MSSVFTQIINGKLPADIVHEDDQCIVIKDIHPQAPVHLLVIPRKPLLSLAEADDSDAALLGHLMLVARRVANDAGIGHGFRLIANNGAAAGQTVDHLHFHILGGRRYGEANL
ncbi:Purine nucleoside phosphoramidase [BD1-7 clade bacterium]|uniref:Purine nucleoside phosphoramidase n=1 Tax=BD1-7 clade bacterium TaxID=2029982 RepID=A0A5S9NNK0_9GAMM|nr:Purine nucleoside phosphoramidase [BD1-7 clade bacterium]